jgi:hypothetical protein
MGEGWGEGSPIGWTRPAALSLTLSRRERESALRRRRNTLTHGRDHPLSTPTTHESDLDRAIAALYYPTSVDELDVGGAGSAGDVMMSICKHLYLSPITFDSIFYSIYLSIVSFLVFILHIMTRKKYGVMIFAPLSTAAKYLSLTALTYIVALDAYFMGLHDYR